MTREELLEMEHAFRVDAALWNVLASRLSRSNLPLTPLLTDMRQALIKGHRTLAVLRVAATPGMAQKIAATMGSQRRA